MTRFLTITQAIIRKLKHLMFAAGCVLGVLTPWVIGIFTTKNQKSVKSEIIFEDWL